jgi:SAM-dependent methyltransferase
VTLSSSSTAAADSPSSIVDRFHWDWYQRADPGEKLLGDITDQVVAELGAGSGRQAAYVAQALRPARVVAIDGDAAQHERGRERYGHLPRLQLVRADAAAYMRQHADMFDVAYSVFGALDFTDPHTLLPAIAVGLNPGGRLIISTLAHYRGGHAPETEARPAEIPTRLADGTPSTMLRWVLDIPVWHKLLDTYGFDIAHTDTVRDPGSEQEPPMDTNVFCAVRRWETYDVVRD